MSTCQCLLVCEHLCACLPVGAVFGCGSMGSGCVSLGN